MRSMRPLELDDYAGQPFRFDGTALLGADPAAVFAELSDMSAWFTLMRRCVWTSSGRDRVGAERDVEVVGLGRFRERMLVWEPGVRVAFTMTATTSPLMQRMAEDWRVSREGTRTRLEWTLVGTLTRLGRVVAPVLRGVLGLIFRRACANVERRARASAG